MNVDLGFATEHRFSFKTNLTERDYPDAVTRRSLLRATHGKTGGAARHRGHWRHLVSSVERRRSVRDGCSRLTHQAGARGQASRPEWVSSADAYFETMGVTLLARTVVLDGRSRRRAGSCDRGRCARANVLGSEDAATRPDSPLRRRAGLRDADGRGCGSPREPRPVLAGSRCRWPSRPSRSSISAACTPC